MRLSCVLNKLLTTYLPNSISALGELTALPQTPLLDLRGLLLRRGKGKGGDREGEREGREGKGEGGEG